MRKYQPIFTVIKFSANLFINRIQLMSFRFIKSFCTMQGLLAGMGIIYMAKNHLGQNWELWPIDMNGFMGVFDKNGLPIETVPDIVVDDVFYVFIIGGQTFRFSINELLIFMPHPHPRNRFIGMSPIQAMAYAVDIQKYIEIYESDFFRNSARVDMILSSDNDIAQGKADEIKERWIEKFRGNFHDVAVLGSGLKPVPLKYTNADFQFIDLAGWSKDMVCSAYRINPALLGNTSTVNRSNSVYVDINFNKDCIQPKLTIWDEEFTKELVQKYDSRIQFRHENPIPRDRQLETQESRIYLSGVPSFKINEMRKRHKLSPDPDGDRILVKTDVIPLYMCRILETAI